MSFLYNTAALRGGWDVSAYSNMKTEPSLNDYASMGQALKNRIGETTPMGKKLTKWWNKFVGAYGGLTLYAIMGLMQTYDSLKLLCTKAATKNDEQRAIYKIRLTHLKDKLKRGGYIRAELGGPAPENSNVWNNLAKVFHSKFSYKPFRRALVADTSPYGSSRFIGRYLPNVGNRLYYKTEPKGKYKYFQMSDLPWNGPLPPEYNRYLTAVEATRMESLKRAKAKRAEKLSAAKKLVKKTIADPTSTPQEVATAVALAKQAAAPSPTEVPKAVNLFEQAAPVPAPVSIPENLLFGDDDEPRKPVTKTFDIDDFLDARQDARKIQQQAARDERNAARRAAALDELFPPGA